MRLYLAERLMWWLLALACAEEAPSCDEQKVWTDGDGDGYGAGEYVRLCSPSAGFAQRSGDCDDADPTRSPESPERCGNGVDDDCDGDDERRDDETRGLWYPDADGDGWGAGGETERVAYCADSPGWVRNLWGDCDDSDTTLYPYAAEACGDGIDSDCDQRDCPALDLNGAWARVEGDTEIGGIGWRVVGLGDIDGDGVDDLATAAGPLLLFGGLDAGVRPVSTATATVWADTPVASVAPAGDLDGDGLSDVWVSLWGGWNGMPAIAALVPGAVRGRAELTAVERSRISVGGEHRAPVTLLPGGDPDGDGEQDLLLGTRTAEGSQMWWFEDPGLHPLDESHARAVFASGPDYRAEAMDHGDVDGDGDEEVLVSLVEAGYPGAERWIAIPDADRGSVALGTDGIALRPTTARQGVGEGLAATVDLDQDGYADVISGGERGALVWYGPMAQDATADQADLWLSADDRSFPEAMAVEPLGAHAVAIGNRNEMTTAEYGAIYLLEGPATGSAPLATLEKKATLRNVWAQIGTQLSAADLDGDGEQDLLVGVPGYPYPWYTEGSRMGAVFVIRGVDW